MKKRSLANRPLSVILAILLVLGLNPAIAYAVEDNPNGSEAESEHVAKIGETYYETLADAFAVVDNGQTIELCSDVDLNAAIAFTKDGTYTLDGHGYTIKLDAGSTETNSAFNLGQGDDSTRASKNYNIQNVVFDGWTTDHVVRLQGVTATISGCAFKNCKQPDGLGLLTLTAADATVVDNTFTSNTCMKVIDVNSWGDGSDSVSTISGNTFTGNICNGTGVLFYSEGGGCKVENNTFTKNTIYSSSHGAVAYFSEGANSTFSGNIVKDNNVEAADVRAGAVVLEAGMTVRGNVFADNALDSTSSGTTYVAQAVYKGDAGTSIDLSENYWGGEAPGAADIVTVKTNTTAISDNYYSDEAKTELVSTAAVPVAKVDSSGAEYTSVTEAINAATDKDTIYVYAGTIDEYIAPWANDTTHNSEKSITLVGADNYETILANGLYLGYDDSQNRGHRITVKGFTFKNKGVLVAGQGTVTIEDNKFQDITDVVATSSSAGANAISVIGKEVVVTVKNNVIDTTASGGINLRDTKTVAVTGNMVANTVDNSIVIQNNTTTGEVTIKDNVLSNWGLGGEGRAIRANGGTKVTTTGNVMTHSGTAPEEYAKTTGGTGALDFSKNYWDGENPIDAGMFAVDSGVSAESVLSTYYADADKQDLRAVVNRIEVTDADGNVTYLANTRGFNSSNCTLKFLTDVGDYNLNLNGATGVVLNLNGYTFSKQINLNNGAELTIQDSSEAKTGKVIVNTKTNGYVTAVIVMRGTLTIEGGTIEVTDTDAAIQASLATVAIEGGNIVSVGDGVQLGTWSVTNSKYPINFTMTGGKIEAAGYGIKDSEKCVNGTVTIEGGEIISGKASLSAETATASVSGGTFSTDVSGYVTDGFECKANADGTYGVAEEVTGLAGGGTEGDPFLITSVEDLQLFRNSVNAGETTYNATGVWVALAANIDMSGITWETGIGDGHEYSFDGCFDGNDHAIKNLTVEPYADSSGYICGGLFGYVYGDVIIKDLTIENLAINCGEAGGHNVGALVGFAYKCNNAVIEGVTVQGSIQIDAPKVHGVGGIVGYAYNPLTVTKCNIIGSNGSYIKGTGSVGGIIGYAQYGTTSILDCSVENVALSAENNYVGGIAGVAQQGNVIRECSVEDVALAAASETPTIGAAVGAVAGTATKGVTVSSFTTNVSAPTVGGDWESLTAVQARIGDAYYATLAQAIAAAKDGDTVNLLADVTLTEKLTVDKAITLDLSDKSITTGAGTVSFNAIEIAANATIKDGSVTGARKTTSNGLVKVNSGNLTLTDVIVTNSDLNALRVQSGATATLNNCTVTGIVNALGTTNIYGGAYYCESGATNPLTNGNVVVHSGTFHYELNEINCKEGWMPKDNGDGTWTVVEKPYVAETNGTQYKSVKEALNAANVGDTVKLLANCTGEGLVIDKAIRLDLGGFTYTLETSVGSAGTATNGLQILAEAGNVTLRNGKLAMAEDQFGDAYTLFTLIQNYADLTMDGVTLDCANGVVPSSGNFIAVNVSAGSAILKNGASIISSKNFVAFNVWDNPDYAGGAMVAVEETAGLIEGAITCEGSETAMVTLMGGTYTYDVSEYCADGFVAVADSNGKWGITSNTYELEEVVVDTGAQAFFTKIFEGRDWLDSDTFEFDLSVAEGSEENTPMPEGAEDGVASVTVRKPDSGNQAVVDFGALTFTAAGVYKYKVVETVGDLANVTYDTHAAELTVTVTDNGWGTLVASTVVERGTFTNSFEESLRYGDVTTLDVTKSLEGRNLRAQQFAFTVEPDDDQSMWKAGMQSLGGIEFSNGAPGEDGISHMSIIDGLMFTQDDLGKTYTYIFSEIDGGVDGYIYDSNAYKLEITPFYDGGMMKIATKLTSQLDDVVCEAVGYEGMESKPEVAIEFKNSYEANPVSVEIAGTKEMVGRAPADGEFAFVLAYANDASKTPVAAATNNAPSAAGDNGKHNVDFGSLTYTLGDLAKLVESGYVVKSSEAMTDVYTIKYLAYEMAGGGKGITHTVSSFAFEVIVTDNGEGNLAAVVQYPEGGLAFKNAYSTGGPISYDVRGLKVLEAPAGMAPDGIEGKFTFILTAETEGAPMPAEASVKNDAMGNVAFGSIEFTQDLLEDVDQVGVVRTKEFTYAVTEIGKVPGITNDPEVTKRFTLKLIDDGEGKLDVMWMESDQTEGPLFTFVNTYTCADLTLSVALSKVLEGRELADGEFEFKMAAVTEGAPMPKSDVAVNDAEGSVDFGEMTFTEPGTWEYLISEVKGNAEGVTYDDAAYSMKVVVFDGGAGCLGCEVTFNGEDTPPVFVNKYRDLANPKDPTDPTAPTDPKVPGGPGESGEDLSQTGDGTFGIVGVIGAIAALAALACAVAFVIQRRFKKR